MCVVDHGYGNPQFQTRGNPEKHTHRYIHIYIHMGASYSVVCARGRGRGCTRGRRVHTYVRLIMNHTCESYISSLTHHKQC